MLVAENARNSRRRITREYRTKVQPGTTLTGSCRESHRVNYASSNQLRLGGKLSLWRQAFGG